MTRYYCDHCEKEIDPVDIDEGKAKQVKPFVNRYETFLLCEDCLKAYGREKLKIDMKYFGQADEVFKNFIESSWERDDG